MMIRFDNCHEVLALDILNPAIMKRFIAYVLVLLYLVFSGCTETGVELRLENQSPIDFDQISVNNISFGSLYANETTHYIMFENIYDEEFISIDVDGKILQLIPEDFDEEEFRNSGRFKFVITLIDLEKIAVNRLAE